MDCSPPDSSVCGILQARILAGVAISSPRSLPNQGSSPHSLESPSLAGGFFTTSTTLRSPWVPLRGLQSTVSTKTKKNFSDPCCPILELHEPMSPQNSWLLSLTYHAAVIQMACLNLVKPKCPISPRLISRSELAQALVWWWVRITTQS